MKNYSTAENGVVLHHGCRDCLFGDHDDNIPGCSRTFERVGQDDGAQGVGVVGGQGHPSLVLVVA